MLLRIYFAILIIFLIQAKQLSPLRYAYDSPSNEVSLQFNGNRFLLTFQSSIQFGNAHFCFRQRPIINDGAAGTCALGNSLGSYDCLTIDFTDHFGLYWQADDELNVEGQKTLFTFNYYQNVTTLIYSLDGQRWNDTFEYLPLKNTIYEVLAIPQQPYPNSIVYTQTFSASDTVRTDNIFFQRHVICTTQGDINHLLFVGGVIRDSVNIYMAAFLSYNIQRAPFSFWAGLSFSKDKASRDMLGVFPQNDKYADLYSIYATAPYKDTSTNINGAQDWKQISSSYQTTQGQQSQYYYISLYRRYLTENPQGDEDIIMKINNKYCFVAWSSNTDPLFNIQQPYVENYMHTALNCFAPDIELHSDLFSFSLILVILSILLL